MKATMLALLMALSCFSCAGIKEMAEEIIADTANVEIMPAKDVKPGMTGYGLTVYKGAEPQKFFFEVLGVDYMSLNPISSTPVIIVKLTSGPREFPPSKTGVVSGMSGSPMYIKGKLVGALAYAFGVFAKNAICGIQPAEIMINPRSEVKAVGKSAVSGLQNIPLVLNVPANLYGLFSKNSRRNSGLFRRNFILRPASGFSESEPGSGDVKFGPGSSLAVYLVRGDVSLAATGTVTIVRGDKIYAFGHPFLGVGATEMPFHQNSIITTNFSFMHSVKMPGGRVGTVEGVITDDYFSAISGRIRQKAQMVEVRMGFFGANAKRTINVEFLKSRTLTPTLAMIMLPELLSGGYREVVGQDAKKQVSVNIKAEIIFGGKLRPIVIERVFNDLESPFSSGEYSFSDFTDTLASIISVLAEKNALDMIAAIDIKVSIPPEQDIVRVNSLETKEAAMPGKIFETEASISLSRGGKTTALTMSLPVPVPPDVALEGGGIKMIMGDAFSLLKKEVQKMQLNELIEYYNELFQPGLFLAVRYVLETEDKAGADKGVADMELRDLNAVSVKKTATKRKKTVIYRVPLPVAFGRPIQVRGQKSLTVAVRKEDPICVDSGGKNGAAKNTGKKICRDKKDKKK